MKKYEQARQTAEKMLEQFPDFPVTYNYLGEIAQYNKEFEKAIKYYKRYIAIEPDNYETYCNLGRIYIGRGQFDAAGKNLAKALQLSPDDFKPVIYKDMGDLLKRQGKEDGAIHFYQKALTLNPDLVDTHAEVGSIYIAMGKFDSAVDHYQQLLKQKPDYTQAHHGLAHIYVNTGRLDLAVKHYMAILKISPGDFDVRLGLANALFNLGSMGKAFEEYKRILEVKPDDVMVLNRAAWIMATMEDAGEADSADAVKFAFRACELTGFRSPEQVDTLAAAYAAAKNFTKAVETAEKAIRLAGSLGKTELSADIRDRLALYKHGRAYVAVSSD